MTCMYYIVATTLAKNHVTRTRQLVKMTHPYPNRAGAVLTVWIQVSFFFFRTIKIAQQRGRHQKQALTKTFASFKKKQNTNSFCKVCLRTYFPQGYQRCFQQSCSFVISIYSCKFVILINYLLILTNWCNKRFSMPRGVF